MSALRCEGLCFCSVVGQFVLLLGFGLLTNARMSLSLLLCTLWSLWSVHEVVHETVVCNLVGYRSTSTAGQPRTQPGQGYVLEAICAACAMACTARSPFQLVLTSACAAISGFTLAICERAGAGARMTQRVSQ